MTNKKMNLMRVVFTTSTTLLISLLLIGIGHAAPRPGQCEAQRLTTNSGGLDVRLVRSGISDVILRGNIIYTKQPPIAYEAYLEYDLVCAPYNAYSSTITGRSDRLTSQPTYMSQYNNLMRNYRPYSVQDFANVHSFNVDNPSDEIETSFGILSAETNDIGSGRRWRFNGNEMRIIITTILQGGLGFQAEGNPCDPMPIEGEFIHFENERGQRVGSYRFEFTVHNRTPECLYPPGPDPEPDPEPETPPIISCNRGVFSVNAPNTIDFGSIHRKDIMAGEKYSRNFTMRITKQDKDKDCPIDITPRLTFNSPDLIDESSIYLKNNGQKNGLMLTLKTENGKLVQFGKNINETTIPGATNSFVLEKNFTAEIKGIAGETIKSGHFENTVIYIVEYP